MTINPGRSASRGWGRWPVRSLTAVAVTLGSLAAVPGTANALTGCAGGLPSVGHCYALGWMGDDFGGSAIWMNAVGTDLLVSCLSVPDPVPTSQHMRCGWVPTTTARQTPGSKRG